MVTDIHYLKSPEVPESFDYCIANIKALSEELNFDFIACLGDVVEGDMPQAVTAEHSAHIVEGFASIGVPYYPVIGNHDDNRYGPKEIFNHEQLYQNFMNTLEKENVVFDTSSMEKTNYYKDFPESNIRLIVLDCYYDIEEQKKQLANILRDAREKGLYVITAMHELTCVIEESFGVTFNTINDYANLVGKPRQRAFEPVIVDFVKDGGVHICHFAGHDHHDGFGLTENGILNSIVPCATTWSGWCDGKRIEGTKTQDCFNVVSIDPNLKLLKIVRVGDNSDHYLREKRLLCFDFENRKVIYNG
jgi:3',5'-cyclic AMP phosphodiesterase CpdA